MNLKKILFLLLIPCLIFAGEIESNISVSLQYNSNINPIQKDSEAAKDVEEIQNDDPFEFIPNATFNYIINDIFEWSYSQDTQISNSKDRIISTYLTELSSNLEFEDFDILFAFSLQNAMKDINELPEVFDDLSFLTDISYYHSSNYITTFTLNTTYYKNYETDIDSTNGFSLQFELGEFIPLWNNQNYLFLTLGEEFFFLRDINKPLSYYIDNNDALKNVPSLKETLVIENRNNHSKTTAALFNKLTIQKLFLKSTIKYTYSYFINEDLWTTWSQWQKKTIAKRRVDHEFNINLEIGVNFSENFETTIYYNFNKITSTFNDSVYPPHTHDHHNFDWNYTQHISGIKLNFLF